MIGLSTLVIADPPPPVTEWPAEPYKGLNYYESDDVPIFAGRNDDLSQCARLLGATATRLFVLHGSSGCGKSSFLRAGLVPFLEQRDNDFLFVRDREKDRPFFLRCTDDPFARLAETIHDISRGTRTLKHESDAGGPTTLDFSDILETSSNLSDFITNTTPAELVDLFARLAARLPETLVVVLDQAEEVFTLKSGKQGDGERQRFFDFMHAYLRTEMDLKIILTLRTEYFGRLLARLRRTSFDAVHISDYLLTDLTEGQLIEAIERPTLERPIKGFGSSREVYRFKYAKGLSGEIARDLLETVGSGGVLPIMQLVCSRLYKAARARDQHGITEISKNNYQSVGGVKGQIEAHVADVVRELVTMNSSERAYVEVEVDRWREALLVLSKTQVDGTVTTELVPRVKLEEEVGKAGCVIPFSDAIVRFLEDYRIVRQVSVYNAKERKEIHCFVLGHDVIGLALRSWQPHPVKVRIAQMQSTMLGFSALIAAFLIIFSLGYYWWKGRWPGISHPAVVVSAAYSTMFLFFATRPVLRLFAFGMGSAAVVMAKVSEWLGLQGLARNYRRLAEGSRRAARGEEP
jgi:hypothetical protein